MATIRKIIATAVAAGALVVTVGAVEAQAAPVKVVKVAVQPQGGGQGDWPMAR